MAILSKMLSSLAHLVTKKTLYVVSVVIIAVAKPACEYTIKLIKSSVIDDTIVPIMEQNQYIMREFINEVMMMNKNEIKELLVSEIMMMNKNEIKELLVSKIMMMNKNEIKELLVSNEEIKELISINANRMNEFLENNIKTKELLVSNEEIKELVSINANRMNESLENNIKTVTTMLNSVNINDIETNIKKLITMLNTVNVDDIETKENILVILNGINDKLPEKYENIQTQTELRNYIETIAKKYAMYLHDEHMELMNIKINNDTSHINTKINNDISHMNVKTSDDIDIDISHINNYNNKGKPFGQGLRSSQEKKSNLSHLKIPTPRHLAKSETSKDARQIQLSLEPTPTAPKLTMRKPLSSRN